MPAPHHNGRAAWASSDDTTVFNLIVIAIGAAVFSTLAWRSWHGQISAAVMALRHAEMTLLGHFTDRFGVADAQLLHANPNRVTLADLYRISQAIGTAWRLPACLLMLVLAAACARWAAPSRFKRPFDLDGLAEEMSGSFRSPLAYRGLKLRLVQPAPGNPRPTDYALTPAEWIARFATDGSDPDDRFDQDAARRALVAQLGPPWQGPEHASPTVQLLFVAFGLHLNGRREDAASLLASASAALACDGPKDGEGPPAPLKTPAFLVAEVRPLVADPAGFEAAREIVDRHAYTAPALMSLLNVARTRQGVLAPAQFAWLRLVDRPLWYALHSLGFETEGVGRYLHPNPRVEAAGARDHWNAETALGAPLPEPAVTGALAALAQHAARRRHPLSANSVRRAPAHTPPTAA